MSNKKRKRRPKIAECAFELPTAWRNSWTDLLAGKGFKIEFLRNYKDPFGPKVPVGFESANAHIKSDGEGIMINTLWDKAKERYVLVIGLRDVPGELHFAKEIEAIFAGQGWQRISPPLSQYDEYLA